MEYNTDRLTKECILFCMEKIRKWIESSNYPGETKYLCECIETLSRAYQNIENKNNNQEETNNESI